VSEILELAKLTSREILNNMKTSIGDDWSSLTAQQKESIARVALRTAELPLKIKIETDPIKKADLEAQLEATLSTVKDWKTWSELALEDAFWKGVKRVSESLGSFLMGAVLKLATGGIV